MEQHDSHEGTAEAGTTPSPAAASWTTTLVLAAMFVAVIAGYAAFTTHATTTEAAATGPGTAVADEPGSEDPNRRTNSAAETTLTTADPNEYDPDGPMPADWAARHAWAAKYTDPHNFNLLVFRAPGDPDYISVRDWGLNDRTPADPAVTYTPTAADLEAAAKSWALGDNGDDMPDRYHLVGDTFTYQLIDAGVVTDSDRAVVDDAFAWVAAAGGWTFTETSGPADLTIYVNSSRCTCVFNPTGTSDGYAATADIHVRPNSTIENTYQELLQAVGPGGDWGPAGTSILYDSGDRGPSGVAPALAPTQWDAWVVSLNRILPDAADLNEVRAILAATYPNAS